jgi:hypothetical protein
VAQGQTLFHASGDFGYLNVSRCLTAIPKIEYSYDPSVYSTVGLKLGFLSESAKKPNNSPARRRFGCLNFNHPRPGSP